MEKRPHNDPRRDEAGSRQRRRMPAAPARSGEASSGNGSALLALQRSVGNGAVARLVAGTAPRRQPSARVGRTLQRLIAVNPAGTPHTDYAIMKQIQQLRQTHSKPVVMLDAGVDFSGMAAGEQLFVVSHGNAADGNLRDLPTQTLITRLNHAQRGVPANIGGITLLSCYSGRPVQPQSLAQQVAAGLHHQHIRVQGAVGFSFGTPEFSMTGRSSVMPEDLRAIYSAESIDDMADAWRSRHPTHNAGILTELPGLVIHGVSTARTTFDILRNAGLSDVQADGRIRSLMVRLKSEIKRIELGLRSVLGQLPGMNVAAKLDALETPDPYGRAIHKWNRLIQQQYDLFHKYYLWTPDNAGAFAGFDS